MKLKSSRRGSFVSAVGVSLTILALCGLGFPAATSLGADPAWWTVQGAVNASSTPNPNATVNQGQLKHFTACAVAELNADLHQFGGAGSDLTTLVNGWKQDYTTNGYATNHSNPTYPYKPSDFDAVTVGQLKYIAGLIWTRLQAVGYVSALPAWIVQNTSTDNTAAVLGQLKMVFNFNLTLDSNNDGLPDWWEEAYFSTLNVSPNALAARGDGLTILEAYQQGLNPNVDSSGDRPAISSAASASSAVNSPFSYQIVADGAPTSYSASGLPSGLSLNTSTGVISGTPTQAGTFSVTLGATNANGTTDATLALTITPDNAHFVSLNAPSEMLTGATATVTVSLLNIGVSTWTTGGYELAYVSPAVAQPASCWGVGQIAPGSTVAPQGTATFTFTVTAPSTPGHYSFRWQMNTGSPTVGFGDSTPDYAVDVVAQSSVSGALQNAGFEQPAQASGSFQAAPTNAGWTFTGTAGVTSNTSTYAATSGTAPGGTQAAYVQGTGALSQATASLAAGYYVVAFRTAQGGSPTGSQQLTVSANNTLLGLFTPPGAGYTFYTSAPFQVASAGPVTVSFQGNDPNGTNETALVDDVRIFPVLATSSTPHGGTAWAIPGQVNAVDFDEGGQDVAFGDSTPYNVFVGSNGTAIYRATAVDIGPSPVTAGAYTVGAIDPGEYLEYTINNTVAANRYLMLQAGSLNGGTLRVEVDGVDVTGPLTVAAQGNWTSQVPVVCPTPVALSAGTHVVRLVSLSGGYNLAAFSFDLESQNDGIPDAWKILNGLSTTDPNVASEDPDGDGFTNLQEYEQGTDPNDATNGFAVLGGDGQTGAAGGYLGQALAVQLTANGQPAANTAVTFSVPASSGQVQFGMSGTLTSSVTVMTDSSGVARVFFQLPSGATAGTVYQVTASTAVAPALTFNETVGDSTYAVLSAPASISGVTGTFNPDGSETLSWTNNTDDPVPIWTADANGNWVLYTTLPAGTTSFTVPAPSGGISAGGSGSAFWGCCGRPRSWFQRGRQSGQAAELPDPDAELREH